MACIAGMVEVETLPTRQGHLLAGRDACQENMGAMPVGRYRGSDAVYFLVGDQTWLADSGRIFRPCLPGLPGEAVATPAAMVAAETPRAWRAAQRTTLAVVAAVAGVGVVASLGPTMAGLVAPVAGHVVAIAGLLGLFLGLGKTGGHARAALATAQEGFSK